MMYSVTEALALELAEALEKVDMLKLLLTAQTNKECLYLVGHMTSDYWLDRLNSFFGGYIPTDLRIQVCSSLYGDDWHVDENPISIGSHPHFPKGINYSRDPILTAFPGANVNVDYFELVGIDLTPDDRTIDRADVTQEGWVPTSGRWYTLREHPSKVTKASEKSGK